MRLSPSASKAIPDRASTALRHSPGLCATVPPTRQTHETDLGHRRWSPCVRERLPEQRLDRPHAGDGGRDGGVVWKRGWWIAIWRSPVRAESAGINRQGVPASRVEILIYR